MVNARPDTIRTSNFDLTVNLLLKAAIFFRIVLTICEDISKTKTIIYKT